MPNPSDKFATSRVAAGALFVAGDRVLLVHKTYGSGWDIPGGYVDQGESPSQACKREIREELGLDRTPGRLLILDWAPHHDEGDKLLFVFDGGKLGDDERRIELDAEELDRWEWVKSDKLGDHLNSRLYPRLANAYNAHVRGTTLNLERGQPLEP